MYYFIGIKGSGMSALAIILKQLGHNVMGSDIDKHFFTETGLIENDIPFYSYSADNIMEGMTIIKGASIKELEDILNVYKNLSFDTSKCKDLTICDIYTNYFKEKGLVANNTTQIIEKYAFFFFFFFSIIDVITNKKKITKNTHSIHWYNASWYSE